MNEKSLQVQSFRIESSEDSPPAAISNHVKSEILICLRSPARSCIYTLVKEAATLLLRWRNFIREIEASYDMSPSH